MLIAFEMVTTVLEKSPGSSTLITPPELVAVMATSKVAQGAARVQVDPVPVFDTQECELAA
jgi:hypothetical protein